MNNIENALDNLEREIMNSELIKEYFRLRALIGENEELKALKIKVNAAQVALSLSMADEQEHALKKAEYENLLAVYDNHPLVANFTSIQSEVHNFLKNIADLLD
ncbi:MAG TPA: YlbF family regulator [Bacilli bacterium]|nr:YlbF family regulator [Bacilli bacterium]HOR20234.1 YlbF family regulator [Bacilli bacterium]